MSFFMVRPGSAGRSLTVSPGCKARRMPAWKRKNHGKNAMPHTPAVVTSRHFGAPAPWKCRTEAAPKWYALAMNDKSRGLKSAYELALERLEQQGIERPREDSLSEADREKVATIRRKAEAKLAELEILHRDQLARLADPLQREENEDEYVRERRRIEERRDAEIAQMRQASRS